MFADQLKNIAWLRGLLFHRTFLWLLFWINLAGTIYGYEWYWNQIQYTWEMYPALYVLCVPDSPTASLFFTLSLLYLLYPQTWLVGKGKLPSFIRACIEAFAIVTSFKYGIWAVAMIVSGAMLGDTIQWQDWMLMISHTAMAVEVLLFASAYTYRYAALIVVGCWTLFNDYMDYGVGIYPWLPRALTPYLSQIAIFTVMLSVASLLMASRWANRNPKNTKVR